MIVFKSTQIYLFFFTLILVSCTRQHKPDLSKITLNIKIERLDQALDSLNPNNIPTKHRKWQEQYGQFYGDYIMHMLQVGNLQDTAELFTNFREILQNRDYKELKKNISETFPDLSSYDEQLTGAFKHILYYFPEVKIPRFVSFFSGFTVQTPVNDEYIGIGLDMFLGSESKFYPALIQSIPRYVSRRFTPENILPRTVEAYIREEIYPEPSFTTPDLLSLMVYNGKIMYLMDQVVPALADSLKLGYTSAQMAWAQNYETDIWAWLLTEDLLFNTDYHQIQKHLGEAPFTPDLGKNNESAPKLGVFIGWQIVKKYMKENASSLQELLAMQDAQQILKDAKYKGR
ncbi:gliding motility lipoprotein GldB [Olivibacter sp. SDN3]|uniref:gliding motility lipoprotein GldB n=1 Tax=Olivibacter sp. SDN3 TaxID=2764720 RepID=UPI0016513EBD|nr:gliding motility lipoprotein GldB [Olivibacter sp. SDN3]QNL50023.1 gliding motility lipoprotein GldB [Olivibacter sp. SDN3]